MRVDETIKEFGKTIGVNALTVNKHGVVHMEIDDIGDLFIDERDKDNESKHSVYVYLLRIYEFATERLYKNAMFLCLDNILMEYNINPVLRNDSALGFIIKHRAEDFTMQSLSKSIDILQNMQDRLQNM